MIKPLRAGILLKPESKQQESLSGLIITTAVVNQAAVVATGPEVKELKLGDIVRYDPASAAKVDDYLLCREADVLCVIE